MYTKYAIHIYVISILMDSDICSLNNCVYIYIYTRTYTYIHTYIYIYTALHFQGRWQLLEQIAQCCGSTWQRWCHSILFATTGAWGRWHPCWWGSSCGCPRWQRGSSWGGCPRWQWGGSGTGQWGYWIDWWGCLIRCWNPNASQFFVRTSGGSTATPDHDPQIEWFPQSSGSIGGAVQEEQRWRQENVRTMRSWSGLWVKKNVCSNRFPWFPCQPFMIYLLR